MKIRAVIFDVYGTLLQVGPPPANAAALWQSLYRDSFGAEPILSRLEFSEGCNQAIARRHAAARARGIPFPEVVWPSVVAEVLPGFARLNAPAREEFVFRQLQTSRSTGLDAGAADALRLLSGKPCVLGIASNAQAYSVRELSETMAGARLEWSVFDRDLCFWSFEHGFSKPDPHVFRILATRLETRGISMAETIVVGDRLDNDIEPARMQGFQTWQLAATGTSGGGGWQELRLLLEQAISD